MLIIEIYCKLFFIQVDCVELDPADDRIVRFDRGAALAAVFQANVLVDDMIAATNYRAHLRKLREQDRGVSIPTIFTRDGYVVEHAGFLDGKRTLKDAKFPFIFAPFSLSSFESYERGTNFSSLFSIFS